ncbi:hypothetical protein [Mucilaginibacter xinganensis]|uniref:Lipocalin-like domain-containing protein n=1 Tax=Mucilaginibacter xinganensis TaxID=1234841 RepID=A0A223NTR6_9SPHI|nr:hypothetical protein [Mucilaginibacter xinganensis]ASU33216.1 hypothetical protein MuYL_1318 [Mucilaginibacter xinganensis]
MKPGLKLALLTVLSSTFFFACQKDLNLKPTASSNPLSGSVNSKSGGGSSSSPTNPVTSIPPTDTVTSHLAIGQIISVGTWKVTSYLEGTSSATDKFSTYTFVFDQSGKVTANQNGKLTVGSWLYQNAIFYYGIPIYGSSPDGFDISFGVTKPLGLLSKKLFISKKTTTNFFLSSINPAENAHVTFTKIAN